MKIEAVLFDVIGTTVKEKDPNTVNNCLVQSFKEYDVAVDIETLKPYRGFGKMDMIKAIVRQNQLPDERAIMILESFRKNLLNNISNFTANEGAIELFSYLQDRKIMIGLGTGLSGDLFEKIFEHLKWDKKNFNYIGISGELAKGRPEPDMILDMMGKLKILNPKLVLKVGDTIADIREGKNAKVHTAVILSGTQSEKELEKERPDFMLKHLNDIMDIIDQ